jgi:hypothetical protein
MHGHALSRRGVDPAASDAPAGKHEGMDVRTLHDPQLEVAIKGAVEITFHELSEVIMDSSKRV